MELLRRGVPLERVGALIGVKVTEKQYAPWVSGAPGAARGRDVVCTWVQISWSLPNEGTPEVHGKEARFN